MTFSAGSRAEEWGRRHRPADPTGKTLVLTGLNSAPKRLSNNMFPSLVWAAAMVHVRNSQYVQDSEPPFPPTWKTKSHHLRQRWTRRTQSSTGMWLRQLAAPGPGLLPRWARHRGSPREAPRSRYAASPPAQPSCQRGFLLLWCSTDNQKKKTPQTPQNLPSQPELILPRLSSK